MSLLDPGRVVGQLPWLLLMLWVYAVGGVAGGIGWVTEIGGVGSLRRAM